MIFGMPADLVLYGAALGLSLLLGLTSALSGSDFDLDSEIGTDHGLSTGGAGLPAYSLLNPVALLSFLGGFGACGFIARGAGLGALTGLGLAALGGLLLSLLLHRLFVKLVLGAQGGAAHETEEAVGKLATVTVAIPSSAGLGAVAYEADGRRQTISARPLHEQPLARGSEVVIVALERHIAVVQPL
ncbi:MAG TPA: hypothetical protein VGE07_08315 [Herpetosiphonaceae bacterium]